MKFYRTSNIHDFIEQCCKCYFYYVECHMSLREVSREMLIGKTTVQRRLNSLSDIDKDMYNNYIFERGSRNAGRKS